MPAMINSLYISASEILLRSEPWFRCAESCFRLDRFARTAWNLLKGFLRRPLSLDWRDQPLRQRDWSFQGSWGIYFGSPLWCCDETWNLRLVYRCRDNWHSQRHSDLWICHGSTTIGRLWQIRRLSNHFLGLRCDRTLENSNQPPLKPKMRARPTSAPPRKLQIRWQRSTTGSSHYWLSVLLHPNELQSPRSPQSHDSLSSSFVACSVSTLSEAAWLLHH